jgi:hypothetical protein
MRPTQATALVPYLCIAPVSGEVGRAGVGHRTRNTLDAGYCLAALTWFRVTLCEICKKAAVRSPRRPCWHGRWWGRRGHGWNRERLKGAIFVVTAVRYSLGWAATAAVLTVMAPYSPFYTRGGSIGQSACRMRLDPHRHASMGLPYGLSHGASPSAHGMMS